jgi:hypothetical protein
MKRRHAAITALLALAGTLFTAGTSGAQSATEITLLHGIPGATVDIVVDGTVILAGVQPGDANDLSGSAGTQLVNVEVIDTSDDSVVISAPTLDLPADGNHSLVAHLDATGVPVLTMFDNDLSAATAGARLTVRHAAAAPPVNVVAGGTVVIENLANGASQSVDLTAGVVSDAELTLTNGDSVAPIPAITLTENFNSIVYAIGSAADATLTFLSQDVALPAAAATTTTTDPNATTTTTDPNATTTTTDPNATTTTTDPNATTTTSSTTTTVAAVPVAVNTGSPLDDPVDTTLIVVGIGALLVMGGAMLARRRVGS